MTDETTPSEEALEAGRLLFAGDATFVMGVVELKQLPPSDRTEVCFAGRSNVGKSSLINALTNRAKLARSSAEPGRTRELNYFDVGQGQLYLVDLPGFGYAKVSRSQTEAWTRLTKSYLRGRPSLRRVFLLVDARRGLMETDDEVMDMMDKTAVTYQVVLTKVDKLAKGEVEELAATIEGRLKKRGAAHPIVRMTSAEKGWGIPELRAEIAGLI
ncbi:MAG: GTP-binding protein [Hyphomonadaceae bacterium BRH_c29]|jgi:GTP-binding protein|nr:MAG: GTP-binding protein [Hyphomonadaceae bacterium BRH_c29]